MIAGCVGWSELYADGERIPNLVRSGRWTFQKGACAIDMSASCTAFVPSVGRFTHCTTSASMRALLKKADTVLRTVWAW